MRDCPSDAADPMSSWDLRDVDVIDHAGALLLWRAWGRRRAEHLVLKPEHEAVFAHLEVGNDPAKAVPSHDRLWFVAASGRTLLGIIDHLVMIVMVLGQVVIDTGIPGSRIRRGFHGRKFRPTSIVPARRHWA